MNTLSSIEVVSDNLCKKQDKCFEPDWANTQKINQLIIDIRNSRKNNGTKNLDITNQKYQKLMNATLPSLKTRNKSY